MNNVISQLHHSNEPSVRFKLLLSESDRDEETAACRHLRQQIKTSPRVQQLLAERDETGRIPYHPYTKWVGAHWVLADLADIGYPPGGTALIPLREQVYDWLFGPGHQKSIKTINGLVRRCASHEGNALYALLTLGLADARTDELATRLIHWQWPGRIIGSPI